MTGKAKQAFAVWKQADDEARAAETRLRDAWERFDAKEGPAPSKDLMAEVSRLRATASDKLSAAMLLIGAARH